MWVSRRLLNLVGMGAAAAFAALVLPAATANAAGDPFLDGGPYETCNGAVCMVMGDILDGGWTYQGVRPFITDWKGDQPYTITYTDGDNTLDAGTYNIKIEDYWNSFFSTRAYQFGDFAANPNLPADFDVSSLGNFGYLSGSSIYAVNIGDFTNLTINGVGPHDLNYWVMSTGNLDYTVVTDPGNFTSAAYITIGDDDPLFLWNSLFHSWIPEVPDYLVPNDPFASLDFDPSQYLGDAWGTL
ncbi:hypothetical protein [[Mycobacterium] holstebronense]|uniref:Uncharacterized protein n=1 Tax=[Mycobacterium] holstebronense TaxID=3064288 RepID=A0ABN9NG45_9MYCO|nr:hypothetical protein [Mycolicibacter sp. MU0102]CAJ1504466.1 hypothetical protein MU0102_002251 [Mycolicibacter sp. MU0102]